MTPTLFGRWQTRLLLLGTLGLLVTAVFAFALRSITPFVLLAVVLFAGFGWDVLYQLLQKLRWDRDWPPNLQLLAGIWEMIFLAGLTYGLRLFGAPPAWWQFAWHYSAVWLVTFLASQSIMRLFFPRWRYNGGQWVS